MKREFFLEAGTFSAYLKSISQEDYHYYTIEILSLEGMDSSKIEGEILNRESLYRNNLKNRFLATSAFHQNFDFHSSLASGQWSLAPNQNSDEPPCQNSDSSSCFGIQSSIRRHFGLQSASYGDEDKEAGMAAFLCDVYETFQEPLSYEMLWPWHALLFKGVTHIEKGRYRSFEEPMQILSNRYGDR